MYTEKSLELKTKLKQATVLLLMASVLYPGWTYFHNLASPLANDSYLERLLVSLYLLICLALTKVFANKISDESKLLIMKSGRWIITTHYFTILYRNQLSVQYAMASYFMFFLIALLFEKPKYLLLYGLYIISASLFIPSGYDYLPAINYQLGLFNCMAIAFFAILNKHKLLTIVSNNEEFFRTLFENSAIGILLIDKTKIIKSNQYINDTLGLSQNLKQLQDIENYLVTEDDKLLFAQFISSNTKTTHIFPLKNGSINLWVKFNFSQFILNKKVMSLVLLEDITKQKQIELEVETQKLQLNHASKMSSLGEMAGGIAHEINNPLAIISSNTHFIIQKVSKLNTEDSESIIKSTSKINDTVKRIASIIKGLKKFSRDAHDDEKIKCSLAEVIDDTVQLCAESMKTLNIEIQIDIQPNTPDVLCRPVEISQVLLNLISNAKDAIKNLNHEKMIVIKLYDDSHRVCIDIINAGLPIPNEIREKIFNPFFTTKPIGEGTGLGLSISHGIMQSHNGELLLKHSDESETCFTIRLPIAST